MDEHAEYHSALHALNICLQARHGLTRAVQVTEALWGVIPPHDADAAAVLLGLLEESGFTAWLEPNATTAPDCWAPGRRAKGELLFLFLRSPLWHAGGRWAVITGCGPGKVEYAICLQPGDEAPEGDDLPRIMQPEGVIVDTGTGDVAQVIASLAPQPHPRHLPN